MCPIDIAGVAIDDNRVSCCIHKDIVTVTPHGIPPLGVADYAVAERIDENTDPREVFAFIKAFFSEKDSCNAIGVSSFGPLAVDPYIDMVGQRVESGTLVVQTRIRPKWKPGTNVLEEVRKCLPNAEVPMAIHTDVALSALAEYAARAQTHEAGRHEALAFVNVGRGIQSGMVLNGRTWHGNHHPETGHLLIRRYDHGSTQDTFKGVCDHHRNCFHALASTPAIEGRFDRPIEEIATDPLHQAWEFQSFYLAQLAVILIRVLSPRVIVFGGDLLQRLEGHVGTRDRLIARTESWTRAFLGEWFPISPAFRPGEELIQTSRTAAPSLTGAVILGARTAAASMHRMPAR
jgi:fructokinase